MKKLSALLSVCYALTIACEFIHAQTITFNSVQSPKFCGGDPVVAKFTVTGNFKPKNPFILQISNANGNFQNGFKNIGTIIDSLPGSYTITATLPTAVTSSGKYRFRVMAALPYTVSEDNGTDISVGELPWLGGIRVDRPDLAVVMSNPITLRLNDDSLSKTATYHWDLGEDAVPRSAVGTCVSNVVFKSGGEKMISVTAQSEQGCVDMTFKTIKVLDCYPKIPKNATVITSENNSIFSGSGATTFWVNPGVTFNSGGGCTIFAEPGSTVSVAGSCIIYLKTGASLIGMGGSCTVIADKGASAPGSFTLECSDMNFDYSEAPLNIDNPLSVAGRVDPELSIFPNPSGGAFTVRGIPLDASEISIVNILGATVAQYAPGIEALEVNLERSIPGTYYLRIVTSRGVVTKTISIQ